MYSNTVYTTLVWFNGSRNQFGPSLVPIWSQFGPNLVPVWSQFGSNWSQFGPSLVPVWSQFGPSLVPVWSKFGPSLDPVWSQFVPSLVPVFVLFCYRFGPSFAPVLALVWSQLPEWTVGTAQTNCGNCPNERREPPERSAWRRELPELLGCFTGIICFLFKAVHRVKREWYGRRKKLRQLKTKKDFERMLMGCS